MLHRVLAREIQSPQRDPEVEITKHQLNGGQKQRRKRYLQHLGVRSFPLGIPPQGIGPRDGNIFYLHRPRFRKTEPDVPPVMGELNPGLVRRCEREDVVFRAVEDAFEDGEIRDDAARVEVLEAVEEDLIAFGGYLQVVVSRVDGTADEVVVLDDELLDAVGLIGGADYVCGGGPEEVVAEKHADGSVEGLSIYILLTRSMGRILTHLLRRLCVWRGTLRSRIVRLRRISLDLGSSGGQSV